MKNRYYRFDTAIKFIDFHRFPLSIVKNLLDCYLFLSIPIFIDWLLRGYEKDSAIDCKSIIPDLLFDCSRVLEYAKIRNVLQSNSASKFVTCRLGWVLTYGDTGTSWRYRKITSSSFGYKLEAERKVLKDLWRWRMLQTCSLFLLPKWGRKLLEIFRNQF